MKARRRQLSLALLALPLAGCAIRPLPGLRTEAAANPQTPPPLRPPAVGQRWTYQRYNVFNSALLGTEEHEVVAVGPRMQIRHRAEGRPDRMEEWSSAGLLRDLAWDRVQNYDPALPLWPAELRPGARNVHRGSYTLDDGSYRYWISQHTEVKGWETVTLARGAMRALRVEHFIRLQHDDLRRMETTRRDTLWLAPETGRWVARETTGEFRASSGPRGFAFEDKLRWELVDWR
jgi:hypothetical protein